MTAPLPKLEMMPGPTIYDAFFDLVEQERRCELEFVQRRLGVGAIVAAACLERGEGEGIVSKVKKGQRQVLL